MKTLFVLLMLFSLFNEELFAQSFSYSTINENELEFSTTDLVAWQTPTVDNSVTPIPVEELIMMNSNTCNCLCFLTATNLAQSRTFSITYKLGKMSSDSDCEFACAAAAEGTSAERYTVKVDNTECN